MEKQKLDLDQYFVTPNPLANVFIKKNEPKNKRLFTIKCEKYADLSSSFEKEKILYAAKPNEEGKYLWVKPDSNDEKRKEQMKNLKREVSNIRRGLFKTKSAIKRKLRKTTIKHNPPSISPEKDQINNVDCFFEIPRKLDRVFIKIGIVEFKLVSDLTFAEWKRMIYQTTVDQSGKYPLVKQDPHDDIETQKAKILSNLQSHGKRRTLETRDRIPLFQKPSEITGGVFTKTHLVENGEQKIKVNYVSVDKVKPTAILYSFIAKPFGSTIKYPCVQRDKTLDLKVQKKRIGVLLRAQHGDRIQVKAVICKRIDTQQKKMHQQITGVIKLKRSRHLSAPKKKVPKQGPPPIVEKYFEVPSTSANVFIKQRFGRQQTSFKIECKKYVDMSSSVVNRAKIIYSTRPNSEGKYLYVRPDSSKEKRKQQIETIKKEVSNKGKGLFKTKNAIKHQLNKPKNKKHASLEPKAIQANEAIISRKSEGPLVFQPHPVIKREPHFAMPLFPNLTLSLTQANYISLVKNKNVPKVFTLIDLSTDDYPLLEEPTRYCQQKTVQERIKEHIEAIRQGAATGKSLSKQIIIPLAKANEKLRLVILLSESSPLLAIAKKKAAYQRELVIVFDWSFTQSEKEYELIIRYVAPLAKNNPIGALTHVHQPKQAHIDLKPLLALMSGIGRICGHDFFILQDDAKSLLPDGTTLGACNRVFDALRGRPAYYSRRIGAKLIPCQSIYTPCYAADTTTEAKEEEKKAHYVKHPQSLHAVCELQTLSVEHSVADYVEHVLTNPQETEWVALLGQLKQWDVSPDISLTLQQFTYWLLNLTAELTRLGRGTLEILKEAQLLRAELLSLLYEAPWTCETTPPQKLPAYCRQLLPHYAHETKAEAFEQLMKDETLSEKKKAYMKLFFSPFYGVSHNNIYYVPINKALTRSRFKQSLEHFYDCTGVQDNSLPEISPHLTLKIKEEKGSNNNNNNRHYLTPTNPVFLPFNAHSNQLPPRQHPLWAGYLPQAQDPYQLPPLRIVDGSAPRKRLYEETAPDPNQPPAKKRKVTRVRRSFLPQVSRPSLQPLRLNTPMSSQLLNEPNHNDPDPFQTRRGRPALVKVLPSYLEAHADGSDEDSDLEHSR